MTCPASPRVSLSPFHSTSAPSLGPCRLTRLVVHSTLAAACQTQWDRKFVEDHPDYQTWIEEQLRLVPKEQNGSLRDYVIHRLAVHGHNVTNPVAPPMAQNNPFPTYTHPSASQYPQASPSAMNPFAPTTVPGSYGSMLAGSTQPQYINPAAMMLQQPQPVASTSTYPSHSALPAQHQPVASTSTARTTALSHFTIPSASSAKAHSPSPAPPSTPVEQWTRAFQGIEPELDSTRMAKYPMRAANHVIKVLEAFDHGASVPLVGRMDVLKVLGNATRAPPKDFCEAWVREEAGRQILEVWGSDAVKRATKAKAGVIDTTAKALVMPLLRVGPPRRFRWTCSALLCCATHTYSPLSICENNMRPLLSSIDDESQLEKTSSAPNQSC